MFPGLHLVRALEHARPQWLSEGGMVFNQRPSSAYHWQHHQSLWSACSSGLPTSTFALCGVFRHKIMKLQEAGHSAFLLPCLLRGKCRLPACPRDAFLSIRTWEQVGRREGQWLGGEKSGASETTRKTLAFYHLHV